MNLSKVIAEAVKQVNEKLDKIEKEQEEQDKLYDVLPGQIQDYD
jgi:hypothetical protein